ncbi:MAG: hypothetical protein JWP89_903 [Schlesneria sp.]|nr:hypothetical protein [Schlesneria sp.]
MSTLTIADAPNNSCSGCALTYRQRIAVLWEWSLRREALHLLPQLFIVGPLLAIALTYSRLWPVHWHKNYGRDSLLILFAIAVLQILGGAATRAAQAISWEISSELRELVRLTGIGPMTLLCCKSLARWVTIGCSVLTLIPLVCLALTLGGASLAQLAAYGWGLLMLTALAASVAALAGIVSTQNSNTAATTAMATFILILLYHMLFWVPALAILILNLAITGTANLPDPSWWQTISEFLWEAAPIMVIYHISVAPASFNPLSATYWLHFLTALCIFRYAAIVMIVRFHSVTGADLSESSSGDEPLALTGRPRCSAAPFFWKDAYVLIGTLSQGIWTLVHFLLAIPIFCSALLYRNDGIPLVIGIVTACASAILFAVRFDSLISTEFRQKTWHDLMLLPIDRPVLLWAKARAICWEHRMAALPIGIAISSGFLHSPTAIFMTCVIAALTAILMCQVAAIYYVTPKYWWSGPSQMLGFLALVVFCLVIWMNFPIWPGFIMVASLMAVTTIPIQHFIESSLDAWVESPEYQTKVTAS